MTKFLYLYHGTGNMPTTEEERKTQMDAWTAWFQSLGPAIVDVGGPVGMSRTVMPDMSVRNGGGATPTGGYSVIEALDIDDATEKAKGCPALADANWTVEVTPIHDVM